LPSLRWWIETEDAVWWFLSNDVLKIVRGCSGIPFLVVLSDIVDVPSAVDTTCLTFFGRWSGEERDAYSYLFPKKSKHRLQRL
jgi:hypothetical protein